MSVTSGLPAPRVHLGRQWQPPHLPQSPPCTTQPHAVLATSSPRAARGASPSRQARPGAWCVEAGQLVTAVLPALRGRGLSIMWTACRAPDVAWGSKQRNLGGANLRPSAAAMRGERDRHVAVRGSARRAHSVKERRLCLNAARFPRRGPRRGFVCTRVLLNPRCAASHSAGSKDDRLSFQRRIAHCPARHSRLRPWRLPRDGRQPRS